jgi:hypothetical protein
MLLNAQSFSFSEHGFGSGGQGREEMLACGCHENDCCSSGLLRLDPGGH